MNETFAPVVEWSTVRMLFSLGLVHDWKTASIDFSNAFTQAVLPEPIYLEVPTGLAKGNPQLRDQVMKIKTSLYGDRRAANLWYAKLRKTLEDIGFVCSDYDPCLFIRNDALLCLYVDDAIIHARDDATLDLVLQQLRDANMTFNRDANFSSYLGVLLEHNEDRTKTLSQPGLTQQECKIATQHARRSQNHYFSTKILGRSTSRSIIVQQSASLCISATILIPNVPTQSTPVPRIVLPQNSLTAKQYVASLGI